MIVLTLEPGEAEKLAAGRARAAAPATGCRSTRRRTRGPPPRSPPAARSSPRACTRPTAEQPLLRRLRVRVMAGGLLDDPELIAGAAPTSASTRRARATGARRDAVEAALRGRHRRARATRRRPPARSTTSSAARADERRYTAPSYEIAPRQVVDPRASTRSRPTRRRSPTSPRAHPPRRSPTSVEELLAWAPRAARDRRDRPIMQAGRRGRSAPRSPRSPRRSRRARTATGPASGPAPPSGLSAAVDLARGLEHTEVLGARWRQGERE